jgi:hypothetical protein
MAAEPSNVSRRKTLSISNDRIETRDPGIQSVNAFSGCAFFPMPSSSSISTPSLNHLPSIADLNSEIENLSSFPKNNLYRDSSSYFSGLSSIDFLSSFAGSGNLTNSLFSNRNEKEIVPEPSTRTTSKDGTKTDWLGMYYEPPPASCSAKGRGDTSYSIGINDNHGHPPQAGTSTTTGPKDRPRKGSCCTAKHPFPKSWITENYIPEMQPTTFDVLGCRGGAANHHEGNKRYWWKVLELRPTYRAVADDDNHEKTRIAQQIVQYIEARGCFLEREQKTRKLFVVPEEFALAKAKQALRDKYVPVFARKAFRK